MECEKIKILLSAYLDKELDPGETRAVEEHLAGCESCRQDLEQLQQYLQEAEKLEKEKAPDSLK